MLSLEERKNRLETLLKRVQRNKAALKEVRASQAAAETTPDVETLPPPAEPSPVRSISQVPPAMESEEPSAPVEKVKPTEPAPVSISPESQEYSDVPTQAAGPSAGASMPADSEIAVSEPAEEIVSLSPEEVISIEPEPPSVISEPEPEPVPEPVTVTPDVIVSMEPEPEPVTVVPEQAISIEPEPEAPSVIPIEEPLSAVPDAEPSDIAEPVTEIPAPQGVEPLPEEEPQVFDAQATASDKVVAVRGDVPKDWSLQAVLSRAWKLGSTK